MAESKASGGGDGSGGSSSSMSMGGGGGGGDDENYMMAPRRTSSAGYECEKRGVKIELFRRIAEKCRLKNDTPGYWSVARLAALLIGNHEILVTDEKDAKEAAAIAEGKTSDSVYRWGKEVNAFDTLTYEGRCSLVEMIKKGSFDAPSSPLGVLRYHDMVDDANVFVSFAYSCDFFELVDTLEGFLKRTPSRTEDSTYFWFDLFVNNQWSAMEKSFEWWSTTFKEAVEKIGLTVVVMLPWETPLPINSAWCLLEMAYSKKLSIALSTTQVAAFQDTLRRDFPAITTSLCNIDLAKATSYKLEDKEEIFAVVSGIPGGINGFNITVKNLLRGWVRETAHELVKDGEGEEDTEEWLWNKALIGHVLFDQGEYRQAEESYQRALCGFEKLFLEDEEHPAILKVVHNLGATYYKLGQYSEAKDKWVRALQGRKKYLSKNHEDTMDTMYNLATLLSREQSTQADLDEAEKMLEHVREVRTAVLGEAHIKTMISIEGLAGVYFQRSKLADEADRQDLLDEADELYRQALLGIEALEGADHPSTLTVKSCLASVLADQDSRLGEAEVFYLQALQGKERLFGVDHSSTLSSAFSLAVLHIRQAKYEEAKILFSRVLEGEAEGRAGARAGGGASEAKSWLLALQNRVEKESAFDFPNGVKVECHACVLTKTVCPYRYNSYKCDICGFAGLTMCYHCSKCSFDAHLACAQNFGRKEVEARQDIKKLLQK